MGCWNGTCMISNLPIISGERIKVIMLRPSYNMKHIEQGSSYVYNSDILTPSFLQISGEYNDYGMIENIDEDWNTKFMEGILKDILGNVIIVDGEEKKDKKYGLEDILEGIERNDLRYTGVEPEDLERQKLAKRACEVYEKSGWSSDKVKEEWEALRDMDISKKTRKLKASWVMIREDVWNDIVKTFKGQFWNPERKSGSDESIPYYITGKEFCEYSFNNNVELYKKNNDKDLFLFEDKIFSRSYVGSDRFLKPFLYDEFLKMAVLEKKKDIIDSIFDKWYEYTMVTTFLGSIRKGWMIQAGAGSQHDGWEDHKLLAQKIINICDDKLKEYEEENEI